MLCFTRQSALNPSIAALDPIPLQLILQLWKLGRNPDGKLCKALQFTTHVHLKNQQSKHSDVTDLYRRIHNIYQDYLHFVASQAVMYNIHLSP